MTTRIRSRGQITIPAGLRQELGMKEDDVVSVVRVADTLFMVPRPLKGDALAQRYAKSMKAKGLSLEDLLKDLRSIRKASGKPKLGR